MITVLVLAVVEIVHVGATAFLLRSINRVDPIPAAKSEGTPVKFKKVEDKKTKKPEIVPDAEKKDEDPLRIIF